MGVARHTIYNLAGSIAPMFVSVVTVPLYLHLVGDTRYGVLAIVWLFLGYFGLFDPGLSRAATYHIARLHDAPARDRGDVFWTALAVNTGFGLLGGLVLYAIARPLFLHTFKMPPPMRAEVLACLPWLAASVPVSIISGVLTSVLQAREWFGVSNAIGIGNSILSQIVPLAVAYFHGPDLLWLIPAILLTRVFGAVPACWAVARALPLGAGGGFNRQLLKPLFAYGGWITASNLLAPILVTADRMLIGSVLSAQAVAFYTVPYNLVTRLSVLPGALSTSLFPKLSRQNATESRAAAHEAVIALAAVTTPLIVAGILALPIFMRLWVGAGFALQAAPVGIIFMVGVWVNGLAYIPYGLLQASNRPNVTAKFHALELLPFLGLLWFGLHQFGLIGAAWAWTLRVAADAALLFGAAGLGRGWIPLLPGAVLVMIAQHFAPATLMSVRTIFALVLWLLTVVWAAQVSPRARAIVLTQFNRFGLRVFG
jgi:O-antigen/teichoic acid export membrane protein